MQALCLYSQIRRLPLGACFISWKGVLDELQLLYPQLPAQQQTGGNRFGHQVYWWKTLSEHSFWTVSQAQFYLLPSQRN